MLYAIETEGGAIDSALFGAAPYSLDLLDSIVNLFSKRVWGHRGCDISVPDILLWIDDDAALPATFSSASPSNLDRLAEFQEDCRPFLVCHDSATVTDDEVPEQDLVNKCLGVSSATDIPHWICYTNSAERDKE